MSVACARSRERHASNPRRPGSSFAVSRSKRAVTSGFDLTCIRNLIHHSGHKVLALASYATRTTRKGASMTTELYTDLDRSIRRRFGTLVDDARVRRTAAALEANGISVLRAADGPQAKRVVLGMILVVGTPKIGSDLEEGLRRINEYVFPLEDARAQAAYGVHSGVNKILIINRELVPGRITVVFVDEVLGF